MTEGAMSGNVPSARRVLIECEDAAIQDGLARVLRESGYEVSLCAGPASRSAGCPLVTDGRCGLVDDAQTIVHALDPADRSSREVLVALAQRHPDTPIIVETDVIAEDGPGDVRKVRFPLSRAALLEAIQHGAKQTEGEQTRG